MPYKIIHFHFDTHENVGDAAVVYATSDLVQSILPASKYTHMPMLYLGDYRDQLLKSKKKNSRIGIYLKLFFIKLAKFLRKTNSSGLAKLINTYDLVIIGGGGLFSKWTSPFDTELIRRIEAPLVIMGAGYNSNFDDGNLDEKSINSIEQLCNKASFIGVRDIQTKEFLKTLNCTCELIGDIAVSLEAKKSQLNYSNKYKVGFNIANHNWSLQKKYQNDIFNAYVNVITKLREEYDIDIYYLQHSIWESDIADRFKKRFPETVICNYDAYELKEVYSNLDLVVSMMLHSSIFAFSTETKFINIAYDSKNYAFMDMIDNRENIIDVRALNSLTLFKKCAAMLRAEEPTYDSTFIYELKDIQKSFVVKIKNFLKNS